MGVAVANQIVAAVIDRFEEQARIVAVQEGDPASVKLKSPEAAVAGLACFLDGPLQSRRRHVDVAKHEVSWPLPKLFDNVRGADIAAVDYLLDFQAFQHTNGWTRKFDVTVRVADDSNVHKEMGFQGLAEARASIACFERRMVRVGSISKI